LNITPLRVVVDLSFWTHPSHPVAIACVTPLASHYDEMGDIALFEVSPYALLYIECPAIIAVLIFFGALLPMTQ
jgi:hypothetical protein